jgi:hypothetical protein
MSAPREPHRVASPPRPRPTRLAPAEPAADTSGDARAGRRSSATLLLLGTLLASSGCARGLEESRVFVPSAPLGPTASHARRPRPLAAPAHPRLAALLEPFRDAVALGGNPLSAEIDDAACRPLVHFDGPPIAHCTIALLANGTAPAIAVSYDCGAHRCDTQYYVFHDKDPTPYHFDPQGAPVTLEVSPDHQYLLVGELAYADDDEALPLVPETGRTDRIEFSTGVRSAVADCISARLSPAGRHYVCRSLEGDVLEFPVAFGDLKVLARADTSTPEQVAVGGSPDDYPDAVEFLPDGRLRYRLYLASQNALVEREASFVE